MLVSCSKKNSVVNSNEDTEISPKITYDTMAIDSFGPGATLSRFAPKKIIDTTKKPDKSANSPDKNPTKDTVKN